MMYLYLDTETYSPVPIKNGLGRYSEDVEVTVVAYAFDDSPVTVWDRTADRTMPANLRRALQGDAPWTYVMHNAQFDRRVIHASLGFYLPVERCVDTMAQALGHGLPGSLEHLCEIMSIPANEAKDKDGRKLMHLFCKPQRDGSRATGETHPDQWRKFLSYAGSDILAMRAIHKKLPSWNYPGSDRERAIYALDSRINERGVRIDRPMAEAALRAVGVKQKALAAQTVKLTYGALASTTQRDATLRYIAQAHGVTMPDMAKATVASALADERLPPGLRELLLIRQEAATASTAKYKTVLGALTDEDRLHYSLQYCGAARTGRWAGRIFQPQNLPRPTLSAADIDVGIGALKAGVHDVFIDDLMEFLSSAIRGLLIPSPGNKIFSSDLANIEGRVLAWLAGESWKLKAYADYDAGTGVDLYIATYSRTFRVPHDKVTKALRQIGKVMELALGFEGGVGAFLTFADVYRIDIAALADTVSLPEQARHEAEKFWDYSVKTKKTYGLDRKIFVACDGIKRVWRGEHPAIANYWQDLKTAFIFATRNPGRTYAAGKTKFSRSGNWVRAQLPSGRFVCYPGPQVDDDGTCSYLGVDPFTKKWGRVKTYGGKLAENLTQATARDVFADGLLRVDAAGHAIVMHVHDDAIVDAHPDNLTADELSELLGRTPEWAQGLPTAADGFSADRYKKED